MPKINVAATIVSLTLITFLFSACQRQPKTLFHLLSPDETGITFNNVIKENDSINPLDLEFLYNGGGVAVGDFNRDGLPDLYFTASLTSNKLYLNQGKLHFKDITQESGTGGKGRWCNAATVVDINNDGWPDIYVCATVKKDPAQRTNLLYINQGLDKNGVPVFKEMAKEYGLADSGHSVIAAFFDYDHDGDLDMYLVETSPAGRTSSLRTDTISHNSDKLFRNDWSNSLHHPVFTDVSQQAGIHDTGFGLGINIADFNQDGWPDIYVSDDFLTSDLLYINNHNGIFTNEAAQYFKHTSESAMGNDVEDINRDGWPDLICMDMNPEVNNRKKKNMVDDNYNNYQDTLHHGYVIQYVRNTLQINQGPVVGNNDSVEHPVFSDVSFLSGVAETDWSWTPSLADFDNDGKIDLLVTNGYPKDVTDHDFISYHSQFSNLASKQMLLNQIPSIKVPNYAFKNEGNLHFENVTKQWGLNTPSFSSGAVYVDLDNDGDLDYVINNINEPAFVYENKLNNGKNIKSNFLRIKFKGGAKNRDGIGAVAELHYNHGQQQTYYNTPSRGYLSSVDPIAHFGLDSLNKIDTVLIKWPDGKMQIMRNVKANQLLTADIANATSYHSELNTDISHNLLRSGIDTMNEFSNITQQTGITYTHEENDFIDFNIQKLLPHKLSQYGPGIAVGDVDDNGLDDIFLGASKGYSPQILLQQSDGKFIQKDFTAVADQYNKNMENRGVLLFDADGDGDLDLYVTGGSVESPAGSPDYQDKLYQNIGKGHFKLDTAALPVNHTSKSTVIAADFDHDGDFDLFVSGRVEPAKYPTPVSSFIFRNDSQNGKIKFTDITNSVAPMLHNIGMVSDALWTDFNNDGWPDLILAGEWMPLTFLENDHGHFKNITAQTGVQNDTGWWNSLVAGDFDNDGDIDYIAGNLGLNSYYRASKKYPVSIYAKDFDDNGTFDAIPAVCLPDSEGIRKEFPAQGRDDLIRQMPRFKKQFTTYKAFAAATMKDVLSPQDLKGALILHANNFSSCYIENLGNGKFKLHSLPVQAQVSPVYGMVADDYNDDGNLDIVLVGNDYGTEVVVGHYDAMNGLLLSGNGKGNFIPQTILQSGFYVPGDGKALAKLITGKNNYALAATQNEGPLELFREKQAGHIIRLQPHDVVALIHLKNGKNRRQEFYYGSSFLSQSSRFITINDQISSVEIINDKGEKREVK